jgi:ADP-ribose pyrophosphatase
MAYDNRDDNLKETYLSGEDIYNGAIMRVQKWEVALPDGRKAAREIVLHHGAAAIVPIDERGCITLVRQHRVAIDEFTWEIPAGKLDYAGEDPLSCAKRELEEETGYKAGNWLKLAHVVSTPGYCTERISLYLATELTKSEAHLDEDEFLYCKSIPLAQAVSDVLTGKIIDLKSCLGIIMAERMLRDLTVPLNAPGFLADSSYMHGR